MTRTFQILPAVAILIAACYRPAAEPRVSGICGEVEGQGSRVKGTRNPAQRFRSTLDP